MISRLEFFITETFQSLRRHPAMAFAAITCVASALFVMAVVGLVILNAGQAVNTAIDSVRISVYFQNETERNDALAITERIKALNGVAETEFVAKDVPWDKLLTDDPELAKSLKANPYPDMVLVKANDIDKELTDTLTAQLEDLPEVSYVRGAPNISQMLIEMRDGVGRVGSALGIILLILSLVIIHHTIELTLYARRKEIHIMSLVGATPTTVALPFLLEGILYGLLGSGVALGCITLLYRYTTNVIFHDYHTVLLHDSLILTRGIYFILAVGAILGFTGSLASVLKYLNRPRSKMTNA